MRARAVARRQHLTLLGEPLSCRRHPPSQTMSPLCCQESSKETKHNLRKRLATTTADNHLSRPSMGCGALDPRHAGDWSASKTQASLMLAKHSAPPGSTTTQNCPKPVCRTAGKAQATTRLTSKALPRPPLEHVTPPRYFHLLVSDSDISVWPSTVGMPYVKVLFVLVS